MKKAKRFFILLILFSVVSAFLSVAISRPTSVNVDKGFAFGAPSQQVQVTHDGVFKTIYYGFPSTYRVQETFKPSGDVFNESSYESMPFSWFYVASNFIFWMALFMALLAPITIFFRPKSQIPIENSPEAKNQSQLQATDEKTSSQVKSSS